MQIKPINPYRFIFAGNIAPDITSCLGDRRQSDVLQAPMIRCSAPHPNLAVTIGCIDSFIGHHQCNHHASLGLELPTLGELREPPNPDGVGIRAGVDEAVGHGNGQDLAVLFEDRGDAPVGSRVEVGDLGGDEGVKRGGKR